MKDNADEANDTSVTGWKEAFLTLASGPGFDTLFRSVTFISNENGVCRMEYQVLEEHQNRGGYLHGGMIATIIDTCTTYALLSLERAVPGVSIELSVSFLRPAIMGVRLAIEGRVLKVGKSTAFLECEIRSIHDGELIAIGKHIKHLGYTPPSVVTGELSNHSSHVRSKL